MNASVEPVECSVPTNDVLLRGNDVSSVQGVVVDDRWVAASVCQATWTCLFVTEKVPFSHLQIHKSESLLLDLCLIVPLTSNSPAVPLVPISLLLSTSWIVLTVS